MSAPTCPAWCSPSRCESLLGGLHRGHVVAVARTGYAVLRASLWAVDGSQAPFVEMTVLPSGVGGRPFSIDVPADTAITFARGLLALTELD